MGEGCRGYFEIFTNYPWGAALNGSVANYKLSGDPMMMGQHQLLIIIQIN